MPLRIILPGRLRVCENDETFPSQYNGIAAINDKASMTACDYAITIATTTHTTE